MNTTANRYGIKMTLRQTDRNQHMPDFDGDHWRVTLTRRDFAACKGGKVKRMTITFSMGYGHEGKAPDVDSVLETLCGDSACGAQSFSEYCAEFGLNEDSRREHKTWNMLRKQAERWARFMSPDYDEIMAEDWSR